MREKMKLVKDATTEIEKSISKVKLLKQDLPTVMVAGKPKSGKSNTIDNIFGINLTKRVSAISVVSITEVTKMILMKKFVMYPQEVPLTMQIINTPGLLSLDIVEIQRY